jgi:hypothetical protein
MVRLAEAERLIEQEKCSILDEPMARRSIQRTSSARQVITRAGLTTDILQALNLLCVVAQFGQHGGRMFAQEGRRLVGRPLLGR